MIVPLLRRHAVGRARSGRLMILAGCGLLAIGVVALVWILVTGMSARNHLKSVRAELPQLRSAISNGNFAKAHALARSIQSDAHSAHALTSGPAWWVAAAIPWAGSPLQTSRVIAAQADRVGSQVIPGVLRVADEVRSVSHLSNATIDLDSIAEAAPGLHRAAYAVHAASVAVDSAAPSWLGAVSSARSELSGLLHQLDGELAGADRAVDIALPMLGESGPKRYFIGFMNEAESRGLGGIPGAFAIVTADHGKITFTHFGSDAEIDVRADVKFDADFTAMYKQDDPAGVFPNSDLSPDFTYAARIWAAMWQKQTGKHVDGAIAVDPTALSYLLKVTGPARLPGGGSVTAQNVVALSQQKQYEMYGSETVKDTAARKAYLSGLAKAIAGRITQGGAGTQLIRALSKAADERRLTVWSAQPQLEAMIAQSGWGGVLDAGAGPFAGFVVNNAAGSKLDYYLDRSMTYRRNGCGVNSTAVATFTVTNRAPSQGLPPYVTFRADKAPAGARPGDNHLLVTYYASAGAVLDSVTLDGKPLTVATMPERGLVTATVDLELPVGSSRTISVQVKEPPANEPVQLLRQPLVRPMQVSVTGAQCE